MKTAFVSVVASLIVTTGSVAFAQEAARQQLPQRATAIQMVPVTQPAVRAVQAQHVRPVAPARRRAVPPASGGDPVRRAVAQRRTALRTAAAVFIRTRSVAHHRGLSPAGAERAA